MLKLLRQWSASGLVALTIICQSQLSLAQLPQKETAKAAKITPDLLSVQQNGLPGNAAPGTGLVKLNQFTTSGNAIAIEAIAGPGQDVQSLLQSLQALGLRNGMAYKQIVFGYLPIDQLASLKNVNSLRFARPVYKPKHNVGAVTSQGDKSLRADIARQTYTVTGANTKIGIMSDSYNALGGADAGVASGDLPPGVQVLDDYMESDAADEGRGMAELIHDVAPGAALAYNTAFKGEALFAKGIRDLAAAGCNIIVDDIGYFLAPFFQDGIVAQAVDDVATNHNVTYFSAAGNSARKSYQSPYVSGGKFIDPNFGPLGDAHDFGGGDYFQKITIPRGRTVILSFQWDDPFYSVSGGAGAQTDMDMWVYYQGQLQPSLSSFAANIGDDPVEIIGVSNNGSTPIDIEVVLTKRAGPDPTLIKWINFGDNVTVEHDTKSSTIIGHPNAAHAIATGAAGYDQTPAFDGSLSTALIETFSSAGGTPILFGTDGQRLGQPGGIVRQKPEITSVDGGNTTFFPPFPNQDFDGDGFPNFFGTSAAAPHAAAVAALMQEKAANRLSPGNIVSVLEQSTLDMDDPLTPTFDTGFDFISGYGFIQADKALQTVGDLFPTLLAITGVTTVSCATVTAGLRTVTFTPQYSGQSGQPVSFSVVNEKLPTTEPGPYTLNLYTDNPVITLKAVQTGTPGEASFAYNWLAACGTSTPTPPATPGTFAITGVETVSCAMVTAGLRTVTFTPQYSGQSGQPVSFSVVNEKLPTTEPGPYTLNLYTDNPVITLKAVQTGTPRRSQFRV